MFSRADAQRRVEPLGRKLKAAVTRHTNLKVTALFFSFLLWFMLSAEEPTEELRDVRLSLVTDTLVELATPLPQVRALVAGPRRELLRLDANPPVVRRVIPSDVPETDTLELRAADVDVGAAEVRVRDVQPRLIPLRFIVQVERFVPVASALRIAPDTGVILLGGPVFEPAVVRVVGPRERVAALDSVRTAPVQITVRDTAAQTVPLDTSGMDVRVEPVQVRVRVPVTRSPGVDTIPPVPDVNDGGP